MPCSCRRLTVRLPTIVCSAPTTRVPNSRPRRFVSRMPIEQAPRVRADVTVGGQRQLARAGAARDRETAPRSRACCRRSKSRSRAPGTRDARRAACADRSSSGSRGSRRFASAITRAATRAISVCHQSSMLSLSSMLIATLPATSCEHLREQRNPLFALVARDDARTVDVDAHRQLAADAELRELVPRQLPDVARHAGQPARDARRGSRPRGDLSSAGRRARSRECRAPRRGEIRRACFPDAAPARPR